MAETWDPELLPGGVAPEATPVALVPAVDPSPVDAIMRGLQAVRFEMAERDGELRDVLARLGRMYQRLANAAEDESGSPADAESLRALLRSVDALATVTESSVDRAGDLGRSLQHMVETLQGLTTRVDRLTVRTDEADARLDRVAKLVEGVSEQVSMIGRHLGTNGERPRPRLRAVGVEAGAEPPRP